MTDTGQRTSGPAEQGGETSTGSAAPTEGKATATLPPDPGEYDTERNALARARGLAAPYIAGGQDPDPESGLQEERRLLRLLLIMVGAIIAGGFVLGIIANLMAAPGAR